MKKNKVGRLLQIIVFATLITTLLSCCVVGVLARYTSTATGTLSLRDAKFDIQVTGTLSDFVLSEENSTASFDFSVTSASEVDVAYDVVITLPAKATLPESVAFTLTIKGNVLTPSNNANVYAFSNDLLKFTANNTTPQTCTLTVTANDFTNDINITDIQIEVVATQIEPNA